VDTCSEGQVLKFEEFDQVRHSQVLNKNVVTLSLPAQSSAVHERRPPKPRVRTSREGVLLFGCTPSPKSPPGRHANNTAANDAPYSDRTNKKTSQNQQPKVSPPLNLAQTSSTTEEHKRESSPSPGPISNSSPHQSSHGTTLFLKAPSLQFSVTQFPNLCVSPRPCAWPRL